MVESDDQFIQFSRMGQTQLRDDSHFMRLYRFIAHTDQIRDFIWRISAHQQTEDLLFTIAQPFL